MDEYGMMSVVKVTVKLEFNNCSLGMQLSTFNNLYIWSTSAPSFYKHKLRPM